MTRHIADHRTPSQGGRVKRFLKLARQNGAVWLTLFRRPVPVPVTGRRTAEFLRIERGRGQDD